jgi:hypothetical protein
VELGARPPLQSEQHAVYRWHYEASGASNPLHAETFGARKKREEQSDKGEGVAGERQSVSFTLDGESRREGCREARRRKDGSSV